MARRKCSSPVAFHLIFLQFTTDLSFDCFRSVLRGVSTFSLSFWPGKTLTTVSLAASSFKWLLSVVISIQTQVPPRSPLTRKGGEVAPFLRLTLRFQINNARGGMQNYRGHSIWTKYKWELVQKLIFAECFYSRLIPLILPSYGDQGRNAPIHTQSLISPYGQEITSFACPARCNRRIGEAKHVDTSFDSLRR